MSLDFTRQSTLIPEGINRLRVTIIGAGAIGSHVAETLCKSGISELHIWDDDTVEAHNLPNQGFYLTEIGLPKVVALHDRLLLGTGVDIHAYHEKYVGGAFGTDIVVSAVDSMEVRKEIFKNFMGDSDARVFVDGRMGARFGKVLTADKEVPESVANYASTLYSDAEALQEPCTARATIFCAYGLAALICATLVKWALEEEGAPYELSADFGNLMVLRNS